MRVRSPGNTVLSAEATLRRCPGFGQPSVVFVDQYSIAEVDERHVALRARERRAREFDGGSSRTTRERRAVKTCRKPTRRWQNREIGGGFPCGSRKWAAGSTRRWKASWVAEAALFDEGAAESALASRKRSRLTSQRRSARGVTEGVRGSIANFARGRQRRGEGALH